MTGTFKYIRLLRFTELSYHLNANGEFLHHYNGVIDAYELKIPENMELSFENCMAYLDENNMVEKFLCSYFHGLLNFSQNFEFYDLVELEKMENKNLHFRICLKVKNKNTSYLKAMVVHLNKNGIFYTNKPKRWSITDIFKEDKDNSRCYINNKDLITYLKKININEELTIQELKEIESFYNSKIGNKIENSYELPSHRLS